METRLKLFLYSMHIPFGLSRHQSGRPIFSPSRYKTRSHKCIVKLRRLPLFAIVAISLFSCGETSKLPIDASFGPTPQLPPPTTTLIPTVNIAPAKGWPPGGKPIGAQGTSVNAFADRLDHPRWLYVLPNGDVLVAETNAPPKPEDHKGIKGWFTSAT